MKLTKQELIKVHTRMLKGEVKSTINKEYGVHASFFSRAFRKEGLSIPKTKPVCRIIGDYFDNIDDEAKAYLLGVLLTDGYIKPCKNVAGQYILGLEVEEKDKELIHYLNSKVKPKGNAMKIVCNNYGKRVDGTIPIHYRTSISNDWIVNTLINNYNFCFSKSQNINLELPKVNYPFSFIRGLLDGDGTVAVRGRSSNCINYYIGFVSISKNSVMGLIKLIQSLCPFKLSYKLEERTDPVYLTRYSFKISKRKDVLWLASNLYKDCEFCLERKMNRLKELSNTTLKYSFYHCDDTIRYANTVLTSKVMFRSNVESMGKALS